VSAPDALLVVDVGTSSVRASVLDATGHATHTEVRPMAPSSPAPGLVELDARALRATVLDAAGQAASAAHELGRRVAAVGIANQRATTVLWERATGEPVGPAIGWQDLRTVGRCLELQAAGLRLAPNASATKLEALLDAADPDRRRDLCFGTVDAWVAWVLSEGRVHATDASNAAVTGLLRADASDYDDEVLEALRVPRSVLPAIVDSSGPVGLASALDGSPPIAGIAGDQQASLFGQACLEPGEAKATFGTGAMLDCTIGDQRPGFVPRGPAGTIPIVAWRRAGRITWGVEAVMLSAGACLQWLAEDLGLIGDPAQADEVAAASKDTGGVWFVPALFGIGTPLWDFGARALFVGLTRGSGRSQLVRAVIEGIAHRGADLLEAAQADAGLSIARLRVDGGVAKSRVFVQALADAIGKPVEVAPVVEATTLGAAFLAGLGVGLLPSDEAVRAAWQPAQVVEPTLAADERARRRERWFEARARALRTVPELSALAF
jgi:glycerol kinase